VTSVYLFCAVAGFAWAGLSALFGAFGGGHGDAGAADVHADFGVGHGDAGGVGHAHGGAEVAHGEVHFPAFGPTAIAGYVTGFGAFGMFAHALGFTSPWLSVPIAATGSATLGLGIAYASWKLIRLGEVSSTVSVQAMVGREARVSVSIPEQGTGEVLYTQGGTRRTAPARGEGGRALAAGSEVRVARIEGGIFFVEAAGAEALPQAQGTPAELPGKKE
jgi:membrane protein implicated in regulation of membrane protease activity